jgi:hypothetical protein
VVVAILAVVASATALVYTTINNQAGQLQAELTAHLQAGQNGLEAAKATLKQANTNRDQSLVSQAKSDFAVARTQFTLAGQIADGSQLLRRLENLPAVGGLARSRHTAVAGIAAMGVAISDAGEQLSDLDGELIKPSSSGDQQGRTLLTVLDQTQSSLVNVRTNLALAQNAAAQVDVQVLPKGQQATFVKARATISAAVAGLDEFQRLVPILTEVLGGNGIRTFLIEQVNAAELRAGGGFIGTYSVLQADHGKLRLIKSGTGPDLSGQRAALGQPGYIDPPGPLLEWLPNTSWSFMDSNFFPDFPANAQAAESFAQPRIGAHIDSVVSIDYYAVAKMLELTGPLSVPGYGITLDANTFVSVVVQHDLAHDAIHQALLSAVAGPLMDRVSTLPPDRWPALLGALNDLAAARHLQAYFNNEQVEKEIDRVGWSATLHPTASQDFLMEVESNLGGTKANYFLTRHFTLVLTLKGSTLHHTLTIDLTDDMPFSYRPDEFYQAYVRLYASDTASGTSTNLRPAKYPNPAPPAGTRMLDGWVPLFHGYGHSARAVFEYDTPWTPDRRGETQLYWQKQPGTLGDKVDVTWNDGSGRAYTVSGDLGQDRVISLIPQGVTLTPGKPAQAQLPSLGLG